MIPVKLTLKGFLSYHDEAEIDFDPITVACISGPNGAGKSSLLDAITWALFGQARRRDDALINTHSDAAEVSLVFHYEDNTYRVRRVKPRGKSTLLEFAIQRADGSWKALSERQLRQTQALIEQTLRVDYTTFVNASFFLQNQADNFARLRPGERKEVLGQILGLTEWERYREAARDRRREIETQMQRLDGRLAEVNAEIAREAEYRAELAQLSQQLAAAEAQRRAQEEALLAAQQQQAALEEQRRLVAQLQKQRDDHQEALARLRQRIQDRESEQTRLNDLIAQAEAIRRDHARWQEVRAQLDAMDAKAAQFHEKRQALNTHREAIAQARARLEQERLGLEAQQQEAQAAQARLADLQRQAEALAEQLQAVQARLAQGEALEAQRRDLQERLTQAKEAFARVEQAGLERRQRKERLEALDPDASACPLCGQPLTPDHRTHILQTLDAELAELRGQFQELKALQRQLQAELDQVGRALAELEQQRRQERDLAAQQERLRAQIEQAQALIARWEEEGQPRLAELRQRLEAEDYAAEARQALQALEAELRQLGYDPAAHEALRQEEQALREAAERLRTLEQAQARLDALSRELADLRRDEARLANQAQEAGAAYQEAVGRLRQAEEQLPDLRALEEALAAQQIEENRLREAVAAARQRVATVEHLKETRRALEDERRELARRSEQYKLLEQAFGRDGVPALLIEQTLPQIEAEANALLDRLTEGALQVRFVTQRPYKDKRRSDLKETLDIQISDRYGIRDYEMYSGGEAFRVNFAIRVALAKVLARRAGARLQTLVIDEGFGSQDAQGRQRIVEAIHAIQDDFAKILVITHIDELKEAFPYRIEVEKTPTGSHVRVVAQ